MNPDKIGALFSCTPSLDPCNMFTAAGLDWDAMLKMMGVRLELQTEIDQHLFIENYSEAGSQ